MVTIILMESSLFLISTDLVHRLLSVSFQRNRGNTEEHFKMIVLMTFQVDSPGTFLCSEGGSRVVN